MLNKRFSIEKAQYLSERENDYKKYCLEIVFKFGHTLSVRDNSVYVLKDEEEIKLIQPLSSKTFWYEIWLNLKSFYSLD
ncbi:hypothetical protein [Priestia aryabhattai]|uniref:hypothetical protein n=1 Tax=Priestia TaxID=2800373 RepID=UPI00064F1C00|nr:hypothetical protein [Priestia aryabhattai]KML31415.1 hypothetical protein VL11_02350 [Priestia aryabhattai]KMN93141.1 hypothetical protein ABV89_26260 [Priestia aryabhattai]